MNPKDISQAKNPDLRAATAALVRAGQLARKEAIAAGTPLVIVKDGKLMFVDPKEVDQANGQIADEPVKGVLGRTRG